MSTSLPDLHSEAVHRPGGFFNLNKDTKLRSINLEDLRVRNSEDQDELEREERRKRGLYGLSNSEKACFSRFTQPSSEALRRATASKEERRRSKSTARSEASAGSGMGASRSDASPKGQKRRLAILVNKQALTDLEMTEEAVHRILRVLFPSNPSAMARVGSSYRRQRGKSDKMLAFQMSVSNTVPLPAVLDDGGGSQNPSQMRRSLSSSFKTLKMERVESNGKDPKSGPEHRPLQSPRAALDQSLKKIWPTADVQQVKKMGDLLKRELNLRSHVKQPGEQLPRRQPLYVTPDASGTKTNVKEFVNSAKLESSLSGEVWDSNASGKDADRVVFHRMKNAAFLVSKIGEITEQINKDMREEVMRMRLKGVVDSANASIAVRRARALKLKNYSSTLVLMQLVMFGLCVMMLFTAFTSLNDTPAQLMLIFFLSSKQFLSAMMFFTASIVAGVVSERAKQDPLIRELKKTVLSCERLIERISDFRIATEELRLQKNEASRKGVPVGLNLNVSQEMPDDDEPDMEGRQVRQRGKHKKKKEVDEALELWAPDAGKLDSQEIQMMQKQLAQSFRRLGAPGPEFQRQGGNRMRNFHERLGGVAEDDMCVQITSKQQQKRQAYVEKLKEQALAKMPKNPPPPALAMHAHQDPQRNRNALALQGPPTATLGKPQLPQLPLAPPPPPRKGFGSLNFHPTRTIETQPLLASRGSQGASSSQAAAAAADVSPFVPDHDEEDIP